MSDATVLEIMDACAVQLEQQLAPGIEGIQVEGRYVRSPTPPCIDVYPGDPFGEQTTFDNGDGGAGRELLYTVRARVGTPDDVAGQELLLGLMDRNGGSVHAALHADRTLGGTADEIVVEGPSGFLTYPDAAGANTGTLLGAEWRLRVEL